MTCKVHTFVVGLVTNKLTISFIFTASGGAGRSKSSSAGPCRAVPNPLKRKSSPLKSSTPSKKKPGTLSTVVRRNSGVQVLFEDDDNEEDFVETSKEARKAAKLAKAATAAAAVDALFAYNDDDDFSNSFIEESTQRAFNRITTGNNIGVFAHLK
jgi:hypothetical protein